MMWYYVISLLCFAVVYFYRRNLARQRRIRVLEEAIRSRQLLREASIRSAQEKADLPTPNSERIAAFNFQELRDALQKGEISCVEVLHTYQGKAIQSHHKTNCITLFIKEAEEWAQNLDKKAKEPGYKKPPLFGVPFSIKECANVAGYDPTKGYAHELGNYAKEDCLLVQQIKELGGIPFVLTNVPQSLLTYSCTNPIYGATSCAYDKNRTSGGSSGGEGALIGSGGSIIGIGSDVGGSIRYPCHFNGIAGIKPSHLRLSSFGLTGSVPGRPLINASEGPMAEEVSTLVTFLREVWRDDWISQRDPYVPPVPWNERQFSKQQFRIGYFEYDGWFEATPALARAVRESRFRLENLGHTLVEFKPPDMARAFQLFIGAVTVDGGKYLTGKICKDIMLDEYRQTVMMFRVPLLIQRILAYVVSPFFPRMTAVLHAMPRNTSHLREIYAQIKIYREMFIRKLQSEKIDALLCPVQVMPAVGHQYPMKLFSATSYCGIYNLLDFAAGTVRVTTVNEEDEQKLDCDYPTTDLWYKLVKTATRGSVGLPVGVQVAAPPYHEETVLKLLLQLEQSVRDDGNSVLLK